MPSSSRLLPSLFLIVLGLALLIGRGHAAQMPAPLRALLVLGGCCHDYSAQKDLLKAGLEKRLNITIDFAYTDDRTTNPPLPILGNPDYAKGYDLVIHDECAADTNDPEIIKAVLAPHRAGIPGLNLHCAMHSYRIGPPAEPAVAGTDRALWFEYLGLQSSRHGPQLPIDITYTASPITSDLPAWTTGREELYNNIQIFPTATVLSTAKQVLNNGNVVEAVITWTNNYHGTRVFSTTIGHNNETVGDDRYLDLIARGVLWACSKLDANGRPLPGYAK